MTELGTDDVAILHLPEDSPDAYTLTNESILADAQHLGRSSQNGVVAMVVWEQRMRARGPGPDDATRHFKEAAVVRKLLVIEISTL